MQLCKSVSILFRCQNSQHTVVIAQKHKITFSISCLQKPGSVLLFLSVMIYNSLIHTHKNTPW